MPRTKIGYIAVLLASLLQVVVSRPTSSQDPPQPPAPQPTPRLTVIISDMHMGVGRRTGPDGEPAGWHSAEDFRWAEEFSGFIDEITDLGKKQAKGKVTLVLNGDTFELWQSMEWQSEEKNDCAHGESASCSEAEAAKRLGRVLREHKTEIQKLSDFAKGKDHRIVIVPGNHDAALLFPSVAKMVTDAIRDHVVVEAQGYWLSDDGLIYAEHGHQIEAETPEEATDNNWSWPKPLTPDGKNLQRSKEERTLQQYYNDCEGRFPLIDNIPGQEDSLRIILASGVRKCHKGSFRELSWLAAAKMVVLDVGGTLGSSEGQPQFDLDKIDKNRNKFVAESYSPDDPLRKEAEQVGDKPISLSTSQICALCERREAIRHAAMERGLPAPVLDCPKVEGTPDPNKKMCDHEGPTSLGAAAATLLPSRTGLLKRHLGKTKGILKGAGRPDAFLALVYGATHLPPVREKLSSEADAPWVVSSGAWQRVATKGRIEALKVDKKLQQATNDEVLEKLTLDDLPACYSAILFFPGSATPEINFWTTSTSHLTDKPCY